MAEWWESAPLAQPAGNAPVAVPAPSPVSAASTNWWDSAPLATEATAAASKPPVEDKGATDAFVRGAAQGTTFNFYDELKGLAAAGGSEQGPTFSDGTRREGLDHLIMGLAKYWFGDKDAEKKYNEVVGRERAADKAAQEQHPIASTAGSVAGSAALPLGAGASATTLGGRMVAGALTGATVGGLSGVGEGDGAADRISRGVTGTAVGGAVGAAVPVAVEGVVRGAQAVATPIANTIRGIRDPEGEAARRVVSSLERDMTVDPTAAQRLTPQEFGASVRAGEPVNLMDIGGETTRALARSAANTSPEGRAALEKTISDRFEGQTPRVTSWLEKNFNYPDALAQREAIQDAAKTANRGAYERVMAAHPVVNVPSEITERPAVAQAMKDAVSLARNYGEKLQSPKEVRTIISGPGYHIADDVEEPAKTSLRYWDYVKKSLDNRIEKLKRGGGLDDLNGKEKADYRGLLDAKTALVSHLDDVAPEYKGARSGAAAFFGAEDALEAGQKIVKSRMTNGEIARGLAKMSPQERKLAQDGFVSDYIAMLRETGDRRNVLNKIADSPAARQRLDLVLGPQKSREMETMLRIEGIMDAARPAVQGNSTTARQLAELGLAGGTYTVGTGGDIFNPSPSALANAAFVYGAARGRSKINENVSRKVAEMLASNDPSAILRGIKIVANSKQLFNSLRAADKGLARVGGEQATGVPALQLSGIGRADDQPNVPRPPGQ